MLDQNRALLLRELEQFLYLEARLQDLHEYEAWEALWTDDGVYWVPANGDGADPEAEMSIIYDNRSRITLRVRQLLTGRRLAQSPLSRLCRVVSNVELVGESDVGDLNVAANALIFDSHTRGDTVWATRNSYVLRRVGGELKMARKTVVLPNNHKALYSLAFLI